METKKMMPDLEQVVYEVIRYFMDWGLWQETFIKCDGKVYTEELVTSNKNIIYYGCKKQTGFRDLEDAVVIAAPDSEEDAGGETSELDEAACSRGGKEKRKSVMTVDLNTEAIGLFGYGEYVVCYGKLSARSKRFLLANTWIVEHIETDMYLEMDELRDQDWIAQDYDSFEEWALTHDILEGPVPESFPYGPPLDLEHPEIYDDWSVSGPRGRASSLRNGIFRFWVGDEDQVVGHVRDVFIELLIKYDLGYEMEPESNMLIYLEEEPLTKEAV